MSECNFEAQSISTECDLLYREKWSIILSKIFYKNCETNKIRKHISFRNLNTTDRKSMCTVQLNSTTFKNSQMTARPPRTNTLLVKIAVCCASLRSNSWLYVQSLCRSMRSHVPSGLKKKKKKSNRVTAPNVQKSLCATSKTTSHVRIKITTDTAQKGRWKKKKAISLLFYFFLDRREMPQLKDYI